MFRGIVIHCIILVLLWALWNEDTSTATPINTKIRKNQVLLLSFDGFRWDYLSCEFKKRYNLELPNFDKLIALGVHAPCGVIPPFVTQTFPSHFTAATGRYIENHGIVGNSFYDPVLKKTFKKSYREPAWWNEAEPIWITARKRNLTSATFFWPGSEVAYDGLRPNFWFDYDESISFDLRLRTLEKWLKEGIDLAVGYFHEPDKQGHAFGPDSPEVAAAVKRMDGVVGRVIRMVQDSDELRDKVNVVLTSDHGMFPISKEKSISYGHLFSPSEAIIPLTGPVIHIVNKSLDVDEVLRRVRAVSPRVHFYRHSALPSFMRYRDNDRIPPVVGFADLGWQALKNVTAVPWHKEKGRHGWSNAHAEMSPIFLAFGPDFKQNATSTAFETVNYYSLLCHLLGISPANNDGSIENVRHLLR